VQCLSALWDWLSLLSPDVSLSQTDALWHEFMAIHAAFSSVFVHAFITVVVASISLAATCARTEEVSRTANSA
jgi:hypothetical protein